MRLWFSNNLPIASSSPPQGAVSHNSADGKKVVTVLWMNDLHAGDVTFRFGSGGSKWSDD